MKKGYWIFRITLLGAILSGNLCRVSGQKLIGLTENQQIRLAAQQHDSRKKSTVAVNSLSLPFFEDFSDISIYPDPARWTDNYAFVNSSFPDRPPSIGVATLDAIDAIGNVYAIDNKTTPSDTLTSVRLNLLPYKGTTQIPVLSFFYQAGGKGELPDPKDSLVLEFYSPKSSHWLWAWKAVADSAGPFQQHMMQIADSLCQDGFRFRFRNYTSMSPDETIGKYGALSNVDQWHLDYIQLNTNSMTDHADFYDITLVEPLMDVMLKYETVPWNHLNYAQSITRNKVRYVIHTFTGNDDTVNISRSFFVEDINQHQTYNYEVNFQGMPGNEIIVRNDPFNHPFTQSSGDYGKFIVTAYISPPASQFRGNDTIRHIQLFKDYYAYDDGTAEYGLGISGESTSNSMIACRFPIYRQDTLRAVDIFFNKTRNQYTADLSFNICVWKNKDNLPGDTLYVSEAFTPDENAGLLAFTRYQIPFDRDIIVEDTVFIGIRQLSEDFINIGFDVSHDNLKNVLFNTRGSWYTGDSLKPAGTVMMRPVFGRNALPTKINTQESTNLPVSLYPVPAGDVLHISINGIPVAGNTEIQVVDVSGRQIACPRSDDTILTGNLKPGMYFLRIRLSEQQLFCAKFIVSR